MKTITFYSFKGGVGRSLALSNIAVRLSEFNRKVCLVDFDLEAPGLQYKFKHYNHAPIRQGLTDYIHNYFNAGIATSNIKDFSVELTHKNRALPNITLIPAGDIENPVYWTKVSSLRWADMFYSEEGDGVSFFLDLKARIEKEINPDFLLIDCRTGITDIAGITLKLFADRVVVLAANNTENRVGSKIILKSLLGTPPLSGGSNPEVHFVLTRLPDDAKEKENDIINDLEQELGIPASDILLLHSDPKLQIEETQAMSYEYKDEVALRTDYLKLFDVLTRNDLETDELHKFQNIRKARKAFEEAVDQKQLYLQLKYLTEAILLDPDNLGYLVARANILLQAEKWKDAIIDFQFLSKISNNIWQTNRQIGYCYYRLGEQDKALSYLDLVKETHKTEYLEATFLKATIFDEKNKSDVAEAYVEFILQRNPDFDRALNMRANYALGHGDFESAYKDIFKAITLLPDSATYYATLAEIYASDNKIDEFYMTFGIALKFQLKPDEILTTKHIYARFFQEEKFIKLITKFNFDIDILK